MKFTLRRTSLYSHKVIPVQGRSGNYESVVACVEDGLRAPLQWAGQGAMGVGWRVQTPLFPQTPQGNL